MNHIIRNRVGSTLFEILVAIFFVAIITSLLFPLIHATDRGWGGAKCANNLKGISFAFLANANDENGSGRLTTLAKRKVFGDANSSIESINQKKIVPAQAAAMTAAIFEILAASDRGNIPVSLFTCPRNGNPGDRPDTSVLPSLDRFDTSWGWSPEHMIPYAYDYSAPDDSGAARVILADRDPSNHKTREVPVCFTDSHATTLKRQSKSYWNSEWATSTTGEHTQTRNGPLDAVVINDEAKDPGNPSELPDNIFDNVGDLTSTMKPGDEFQVGTGNPRRAFVK